MKYLRAVGFFLGTLGIYLAPPLLGWGIGDLRGFFSLYPRLGYAALVAALGLVAGYQAIGAPEGIRGGKGEKGKLVRRQSIVKVVVILLMYGALAFLPFADRRNIGVMFESQAMRWPGLAFAGLGFALIFWSGFALGRLYSADVTIQKDHRLITTGPYRYIRHPGYVGYTVSFLGMSLALGSLWAIIPAGLIACLLVVRTALEDRTLQDELPGYKNYAQRVRYRLLPGIW